MATCKICLKKYKHLKYRSSRVCICGRCTNDLNKYKQVADKAYHEARQMLERGILRRAQSDLFSSKPSWIHEKAAQILRDPSGEVERAFPGWVNRLVADHSNSTKVFKIIRAERRGLLHCDEPHRWGYPKNWTDVAGNIRKLDKFACVACNAIGIELHVHHIVYVSNYGTHRKTNLITLCRRCHELEHKRVFDKGENMVDTDLVPED